MSPTEKKYLIRILYLLVRYMAGFDVKKEAAELSENIRIIFRGYFQ